LQKELESRSEEILLILSGSSKPFNKGELFFLRFRLLLIFMFTLRLWVLLLLVIVLFIVIKKKTKAIKEPNKKKEVALLFYVR